MNTLINWLNGLLGYFIAVLLVVVLAIILGYLSIISQRHQATNYYSLDKSAIQMKSTANAQHYKLTKE